MLIFLACILGFVAGAFLLVQIGICLFFAIPTTKKLYSQGLIKNKDEIILRYSLSVLFLSLVYLVILGILFAFATVGFLKAFVFASLATFVIGRLKGPIFYNEANMKEYLKSNAKHFAEKLDEQSVFNLDNTDKKVSLKLSKEDVESLRLKIRSWANSRRGNVDSFFSIFEHLKLKENYKFDYVFDSENSVYPYIRGNTEQKIKDFKDYETINSNYFSDSKDESFFDKDMDKIELDGSAISFYELVVFNYYIKIFFFSPSEYGGKIILNDVDKNGIMNRYEDDNFYTNEEKNVINNLDLSDPVKSRNKVNYVSIVDTDASFEMRKKEYKITKDNHIMLENETTIIPYKILF